MGGLGNQLFQYAFLYALIQRENAHPKIKSYMCHDKHEDERQFALSPFNVSLKLNVKEEKVTANYYCFLLYKRKLLKMYAPSGLSDCEETKRMIKHGIYHFKDYKSFEINDIHPKRNSLLIESYFLSYKYFDEYRENFKREFSISVPPSPKAEKLLAEISSCNSVCLHIRMGDYNKKVYSFLKICDYDYYKKGMEYISSKIDNPVFYVFSNGHKDIEWIKQNYDFSGYTVKYVDINNPDYEDLRLMIACKHFVISNSTYSWWAQYLCDNKNKIVVAPSKWDRNAQEKSPLIMPEFKIIDVK